MLLATAKASNHLQYAFLTGIQRVAKENIFSDLNNLVVNTVMDEEYCQYFGFDEQETLELLNYYGLELNDEIKKMYDGYHIGNLEIYNPWSIINYCKYKKVDAYWVNTSGNQMIKSAMKLSNAGFKEDYDLLIQQGYLDTYVNIQTSFYEVTSEESLWGLFVNAGYLTIERRYEGEYCRIKIPNDEVKKELTPYYLDATNMQMDKLFNALKYEKKRTVY